MRVPHWCILVVTILMLVCEVTISLLYSSHVILVDGFHTLVVLMRMTFIPQTVRRVNPPSSSSLDSPGSAPRPSSTSAALPPNLPVESSIRPLPGTQATSVASALPDQPPTPAVNSSPSYSDYRIQILGDFISTLMLLSLCVSFLLEISSSHKTHPVQHPLILVQISTVSLLHKMLVLWQNRPRRQAWETKSPLEGKHKVLGEEEVKGEAEPKRRQAQAAVQDSLHQGALVLCNPQASSVPETDPQTPEPPSPHAPPPDSNECAGAAGVSDLSRSTDIMEVSKDSTRMGRLGNQNVCNVSPVCTSHDIERPVNTSQWTTCLLLLVCGVQGLCSSLLALVNSLVMLLLRPQCLHSPGGCSFLVHVDLGLSLLAIIVLIVTAAPQLHRYGLLLLQATPPHICVSELRNRIASVPGVKGVHELHIWQLNESFAVASVHVHCHAGFQTHRCADLMSGVCKVLQSVGVNCCTIQPEFASCSGSTAGSNGASPVLHREGSSPPRVLACSLACAKACADNMCCSPVEEGSRTPPAGGPNREPQALVIENTCSGANEVNI